MSVRQFRGGSGGDFHFSANTSLCGGRTIPERMAADGSDVTAEDLLAHAAWLRHLAFRLVQDHDIADDLVQETWIAALRRSPDAARSLRPWLAKVLRDGIRMRRRGEGRRAAREDLAAVARDEVPTPEFLVERAEAQKVLVELVLRLEEPYRTSVLLHFYEGLTAAEISRAQGVPAGTVRWRLKVAVDQIRAWLDERMGDRRRWAVALMALPKGALVMKATSKTAVAIVLLFMVLGTGFIIAFRRSSTSSAVHAGGNAAVSGARRNSTGSGGPGSTVRGAGDRDVPTAPRWFFQRGAPTRRIAGKVVFEGAPVAGAVVTLSSALTEAGAIAPTELVTGPDGLFDFGRQPPATFTVSANHPRRIAAMTEVNLRDPAQRPAPERLVLELLPCRAALYGQVSDASGGAIQRARVRRFQSNQSIGPSVETNERGEYELCLEESEVTVEVGADGYGAVLGAARVLGRVRRDFSLTPEATIDGRVVRAADDSPVPGAFVYLYSRTGVLPSGERNAPRLGMTDERGAFHLQGVSAGRYGVGAYADGVMVRDHAEVIVDAGTSSADVVIRVEAIAEVEGHVVNDGTPVPGARVTAVVEGSSLRSREALTQEDGSFVLSHVPYGTVRFRWNATLGVGEAPVEAPAQLVVDRPIVGSVVLEVESLGVIGGVVRHGGTALPAAVVALSGPRLPEMTVRSDADGRFEVRGLEAGAYLVWASSRSVGAFNRGVTVTLHRGERRQDLELDLDHSASISGVVVDENDSPLPGLHVACTQVGGSDSGDAMTAADGSFTVGMLAGSGDYRVEVRRAPDSAIKLLPANGGAPLVRVEQPDSVITGVLVAIRLEDEAIAGKVVDEHGSGVSDAKVIAVRVDEGDPGNIQDLWGLPGATTGADGSFVLSQLTSGTYIVLVKAGTGEQAIARNVRAGRRDLRVVVKSVGRIVARTQGFVGRPSVFAHPVGAAGWRNVIRGRVEGEAFAVDGVAPGSYVVVAQSSDEVSIARVEVRPGGTSTLVLRSGGSGTVSGRVLETATGSPVAGMSCRVVPHLDGIAVFPGWDGTAATAVSDDAGEFALPHAAAGDVEVLCASGGVIYQDGRLKLSLARDEAKTVEVRVSHRPQ